ncbi:CDGSH iron-sulfur domain-containing protein [Streptomyces sp. NPDC048462]|uniref:CDGSH iron-sulfur domain-containing protein n=1 Tax=Streptomyces sp. NPDC048462 TaxID=3365555 RepID=UPI00372173E1
MPNAASDRPRRVTPTREGPVLLEGPVEVTLDDGSTVTSDRFTVALCVCRRSRAYPWCDTSHRRGAGARADREPRTASRPAPDAERAGRRSPGEEPGT